MCDNYKAIVENIYRNEKIKEILTTELKTVENFLITNNIPYKPADVLEFGFVFDLKAIKDTSVKDNLCAIVRNKNIRTSEAIKNIAYPYDLINQWQ